MEKELHELNQAMNRVASGIDFSVDELASFVDVIRLYRDDHARELSSELRRVVDNLPSGYIIKKEMNYSDLRILSKTIGYLWKEITGERLIDVERLVKYDVEAQYLEGCYWLLPGEILVSGFNHFDAAKKHKSTICSLLDINPMLFEKALASRPDGVIKMILKHNGVRVLIRRDASTVFMQSSESGWPLARDKLKKMSHKKKMLRVLDDSKPYKGWDSGVLIIIH